ncbi:hypothetical protein BDR03DRAFT_969313 [Suillus americanus]|nr:hypothetical protein BDR03DRAFT_969313 [Suillus americanus]
MASSSVTAVIEVISVKFLAPLLRVLVIIRVIGIKFLALLYVGTFRDAGGSLRGVRCSKNHNRSEHAEDKRKLHV